MKTLLQALGAGVVLLTPLSVARGVAQSPSQSPTHGPDPGSKAALITKAEAGKWAIVLHGGAGVIERTSMTPERDAAYRAGLETALRAAARAGRS